MAKESYSDIDWSLLGNEQVVNQIDEWVRESKIGHRMAYNIWRLHTEKDMTAFMLRWNDVVIDL